MKRHRRHSFNLVELSLALAIAGVGIAGLMALFQMGMVSSRNAMGDNYSADAVDQFVTYISQQAMSAANWDMVGVSTTYPFADFEGLTFLPMYPNPTGSDKTDPTGNLEAGTDPDTDWTEIPYTNISSCNTVPGLYRVMQGSETAIDFEGSIRIWQSVIREVYFNEAHTSEDIRPDFGVGINIEISWPTTKPYAKRETRRYYVEIFNRNATTGP